MTVRIEDIKVKKRIRKNNGGIDELAESMRIYGLLNPIVIDTDCVLIAGFRRLQAAKTLGWSSIPATVVDTEDKAARVALELEENIQRSNFTHEELLEGYEVLKKLQNPGFFRRIAAKIKNFFRRIFAGTEQSRAAMRKKNALMSLNAPLAVILAAASGILHKNGYISALLLSALNLVSLVLFLCGLFFFIRFKAARPKKTFFSTHLSSDSVHSGADTPHTDI